MKEVRTTRPCRGSGYCAVEKISVPAMADEIEKKSVKLWWS